MRLAFTLALAVALSACVSSSQSTLPQRASSGAAVTDMSYVTEAAARADATTDRQVTRSARLRLTIRRDAAPALAAQARQVVEGMGGYVAAESPAALTVRVPDARLDEALNRLSALALGAERSVQAVDVTETAVNLQIRLENAQALQARLRALLADATSVTEAVAVERELARATAEVEVLEAQVRALQERIALASVTVSLRERVRPGPLGWVFVGAYRAVEWLFVQR